MLGRSRPRRTMLSAALILLGLGSLPIRAEIESALEKYRAMLKADPWSNPGMLDVDRGEALWKAKRGPRNVSLEACDLGKGPGQLDGAFALLPRYFADAGRVMDAEARLVWCAEKLQGFARSDVVKPWPASGQPATDLAAITTYVASKSQGNPLAPRTVHPQERAALALGEALFWRRQGPMDFACASCHAVTGRRIRLQSLPALVDPQEARAVVGEWPAYRVSSAHVMTMQHRLYDCYWQMRLPAVELGSPATVALTMYLARMAAGGAVKVPGLKR